MAWKGKKASTTSDSGQAQVRAADQGRSVQGTMKLGTNPPLRGKLISKKGSSKSDAPDNAGTATHRKAVKENPGSRLSISPNMNAMPSSNPESGNTQANGRIVRSTNGRWGNFDEGADFARMA